MEANRHRNRIRILRKALQLLKQCKVPQFHPTTAAVGGDPNLDLNGFDQMQIDWSECLVRSLPRMVDYIHRHQQTIFREELGQLTWKVRKYFVLVYFEHTGSSYERAEFQLDNENVSVVEERLDELKPEVFRILTLEVNAVVQNWLFHYYGSELALAGWQCRPGETFGFCRLWHYLMERRCLASMAIGSRMLAFAENLAMELFGYKAYFVYQRLGLGLLEKLMRANYLAGTSTDNAEDILSLALRWILKDPGLDYWDLWEVIFFAVKSIPYEIPSLDDEIMRILVSSLIDDVNFDYVHITAAIRMLLLDLPEAQFDGMTTFSISGRNCELEEFGEHVKTRLHTAINPKNLRISTRWRLQIGQLIPHILGKVIDFSLWNPDYQFKCLNLLLRLTLYPIEQRRVRTRLRLNCCLFDLIFTPYEKLVKNLRRCLLLEAEGLREDLLSEDTTYYSTQLVRHRELRNINLTVQHAAFEMMQSLITIKRYPTAELNKRFLLRHKRAVIDLVTRIKGLFLVMQELQVVLEDFSVKLASLVEPNAMQNGLQNEHQCGC